MKLERVSGVSDQGRERRYRIQFVCKPCRNVCDRVSAYNGYRWAGNRKYSAGERTRYGEAVGVAGPAALMGDG